MQRPAGDAEDVHRNPFPLQGRNAHAMLNGLYSAAAGMIAQQTRMDALANDISRLYWLNGLGFSRASSSSSSMLRRDLSLAVIRLRR